ncbi:hypothetical protein BH24ACT3_BH24ACT3_14800 [soil metagenome]
MVQRSRGSRAGRRPRALVGGIVLAFVASLLAPVALTAPVASAAPQQAAAPAQADREIFPGDYDTSAVRVGEERTVSVAGVDGPFRATCYTNDAYRCGRTGHYSYLVVERTDLAGRVAPLWVNMPGGGVGYYGEDGVYHGGEFQNDEDSADDHLRDLARRTQTPQGAPADTVVSRRLAEGWRVMFTSLCDHDLYSGVGNVYPNNPNWGDDPDTFDGLLATMAAVDATVNGTDVVDGHPSSHVFVHGQSAGSVGAYSVSYAFSQAGINLTGAVLDSYLISDRLNDLFDAGVTPQQRQDPDGDYQTGAAEKIGPFVSDPTLFAEQTVAGGFDDVHLFDLQGTADPFCAGQLPPIAPAVAAGFDNNCRYVHGLLADAVSAQGGSPHRVVHPEGVGHVPTSRPGPVHDLIDDWIVDVLAVNPADPWPRDSGIDGPGYPAVRDILGACPVGTPPPDHPDVAASNVHRDAIGCLSELEIVRGRPDGTFGPGDPVSRGQVASFLARLIVAAGGELPNDPPDAFDDDQANVHEEAINQLAALGIVQGTTATSYSPSRAVTRAQLASLLVRTYGELAGEPLAPAVSYFRDVEGVHAESIFAAAQAGLTGGTRQGLFSPSRATPRDQAASLLARMLDLLVEEGVAPAPSGGRG